MVSVISYNIQKGKKLQKIIAWMQHLEILPDIVCFQEFPGTEIKKFLSSVSKKQVYEYEFGRGFVKGKKNLGN